MPVKLDPSLAPRRWEEWGCFQLMNHPLLYAKILLRSQLEYAGWLRILFVGRWHARSESTWITTFDDEQCHWQKGGRDDASVVHAEHGASDNKSVQLRTGKVWLTSGCESRLGKCALATRASIACCRQYRVLRGAYWYH